MDKKDIAELRLRTKDLAYEQLGISNALLDEVERLQARIAELEGEHRWIPISERLPEDDGRYFIRYKYGDIRRVFIADYLQIENRWMSADGIEVTHWMPPPPESEE